MAEDAPAGFAVPQRLWRATVEDTVDKVRAFQQAVIATEVRKKIYGHAGDDKAERKRLLVLARSGRWREDPWLSRQVRKAFADRTPRPRVSGRIVADNCSYDVSRDEKGQVWLAVMTNNPGQRLRVNLGPLPEQIVPTSTIQIRADGWGRWQVIAAYPDHPASRSAPSSPIQRRSRGLTWGSARCLPTPAGTVTVPTNIRESRLEQSVTVPVAKPGTNCARCVTVTWPARLQLPKRVARPPLRCAGKGSANRAAQPGPQETVPSACP